MSGELKRALRVRHLVMLSVGGTIASGFFLAAGQAISIAGPSVIITYLLAGIVALCVMGSLAEISVLRPVAGSFAIYAQDTIGPWAGFLTGWNYWMAWVMGNAAESIAVGTFVHSFYPQLSVGLVAFMVVAFEGIINVGGVLLMGEYEFIFSTIKLIALVVFIVVGICAILGVGIGHPLGLHNLTNKGGFFPTGIHGMFASLLTVFFAYTGLELVSVTSEESVHPERDIPRALLWTAALVGGLFVIGSVVLLSVFPWTKAGVSSSPFVNALSFLHLPPTFLVIFNFIIVIASLSGIDGGMYTASRMLFAMAREGYFPKRFAKTHPTRKTPTLAIVVTSTAILIGAVLAIVAPTFAYTWVFGLATFGWMWAWFMIGLAHIRYRSQMTPGEVGQLKWRMPLYPLVPIIIMISTAGAIIGQFFVPNGWVVIVAGAVWIGFALLYYVMYARQIAERRKSDPEFISSFGESETMS